MVRRGTLDGHGPMDRTLVVDGKNLTPCPIRALHDNRWHRVTAPAINEPISLSISERLSREPADCCSSERPSIGTHQRDGLLLRIIFLV